MSKNKIPDLTIEMGKCPKIETERLIVIPLTLDLLNKYIKGDDSLAIALQLKPTIRAISFDLVEAFKKTIFPSLYDPTKNYLYSTLWTIIYKEENVMVGDLMFKGEPNEEGQLEIGYGLDPEFMKKGFMTEALDGFTQWAFNQPGVNSIIAETENSNLPSQRILERNNFCQTNTIQNMIWWKLEKPGLY